MRWYHSSAARTVCTGCFLYLAPFLLLLLLLWWFCTKWMLDTTTRICETLTCGLCKFSQAAASGLHLSFQTHSELHKPWKNIYCILSKCFSNWSKMLFQKWKPGVVFLMHEVRLGSVMLGFVRTYRMSSALNWAVQWEKQMGILLETEGWMDLNYTTAPYLCIKTNSIFHNPV